MPFLLNRYVRRGRTLVLGALCVCAFPLQAVALDSVPPPLPWGDSPQCAGASGALEVGGEGQALSFQRGGSPGREAPFVSFDWGHWAVRSGGFALALVTGGALCLGFYNRRMRAEISRRIESESEREDLIAELTKALEEVRELNGLLPICSSCLKIRNDTGYWEKLESYIESHTKARFSHGICSDCMKERYPYLFDDEESGGEAEDFYNKESGIFPSSEG